MDAECLHDLRWVHVLTIEGDIVISQLFLCCLDVARLEGLGFLLFDSLQDIAEFVPINVDELNTLTI
eukprot:11418292-Karenia_brevis.AAC.1